MSLPQRNCCLFVATDALSATLPTEARGALGIGAQSQGGPLTRVCIWCFPLRDDRFLRVRRRARMWFRKQQCPGQPVCLVPKRCQKAICLPSPQIDTYPCQGGRMRSSGFCRGIRESIRSRACPRENGGTVPGGSCASCPGIPNPQTACPRENGGRLVHLPLPPTSIPYRTSASPALLCHITTDLFRGLLNQSQGDMRRRWGSNDGAGSFSKYG